MDETPPKPVEPLWPPGRHVRNRLEFHDPTFIDNFLPLLGLLEAYFRYETEGLGRVPADRACIVVLNHGALPIHGFLLYQQLILQRGIYPRGLSAGFIYDVPGMREVFLKGGAVNANRSNGRALLEQGACLMIAPGGIYESLVCKPGMRRIPWERRLGFVSLAVETGTCIVPSFCHGANEMYFNTNFMLRQRIKFLEATRLPIPGFFGLGPLPLPVKLRHVVGEPIEVRRREGESQEDQVARTHTEVLRAMEALAGGSR